MGGNSFDVMSEMFAANSATIFQDLMEDDQFKDVTLVSEDDKQIDAHKVILSSSSGFFKRLLGRNMKHQHPLIFLKGVTYSNLLDLLSFIYRGQAQVAEENMETFLQIGQDLEVRSLDVEAVNRIKQFKNQANLETVNPKNNMSTKNMKKIIKLSKETSVLENTFEKVKNYQCDNCDFQVANKSIFEQHNLTEHRNSEVKIELLAI